MLERNDYTLVVIRRTRIDDSPKSYKRVRGTSENIGGVASAKAKKQYRGEKSFADDLIGGVL